jgi:hypothetical protein
MNFFDMNSEVCNLRAEEEAVLASFTWRLIEIAAVAGARESGTSPAAALNAMRLPAIALDKHGFVAEVNAAAEAIFDDDVKLRDRRLFVRDPKARALLKEAVDQLKTSLPLDPLATAPIIVQRQDKLPVLVRTWRFDGRASMPNSTIIQLNSRLCKFGRMSCAFGKFGHNLWGFLITFDGGMVDVLEGIENRRTHV